MQVSWISGYNNTAVASFQVKVQVRVQVGVQVKVQVRVQVGVQVGVQVRVYRSGYSTYTCNAVVINVCSSALITADTVNATVSLRPSQTGIDYALMESAIEYTDCSVHIR